MIELLGSNVAVLSPHLDDAILSLGSLITTLTFTGAKVRVVTLFAGDPASDAITAPYGWDRRAGFLLVAQAIRARRGEDEFACAAVGAEVRHLPFADEQTPHGRENGKLLLALREATDDCSAVLLPGYPLPTRDHLWTALVGSRLDLPAFLYAEEPYRYWWTQGSPPPSPLAPEAEWYAHVDEGAAIRKAWAIGCYATQLELLAKEYVGWERGSDVQKQLGEQAATVGEFITQL